MEDRMMKVYQKFYSCLNHLGNVYVEGDCIDNISYIDAFLSEFRSITLVLQKQFSDDDYKTIYEKLRDKYLIDDYLSKLLDFRNESVHENPFDLGVNVVCFIYLKSILKYGVMSGKMSDKSINKNAIEKKINNFLRPIKINFPEIYFTYEIEFISNLEKVDIIELAEYGINRMYDFLIDFEKSVYGDINDFDVIKKKISDKIVRIFSNKFKFSVNGLYNVKNDKIEISESKFRLITVDKNKKPSIGIGKTKISKDNFILKGETIIDKFKSFILTHLVLFKYTKDLAPVFALIYEDGDCELVCNPIFSKADFYDTVEKIASRIKHDKINTVIACQQMIAGEKDLENFSKMTHDEKMKNYDSEGLCFSLIDKNESIIHLYVPSDKVEDVDFVMSQIYNGDKTTINYGLIPIENEMKKNFV